MQKIEKCNCNLQEIAAIYCKKYERENPAIKLLQFAIFCPFILFAINCSAIKLQKSMNAALRTHRLFVKHFEVLAHGQFKTLTE
jgi:hypothetical protein